MIKLKALGGRGEAIVVEMFAGDLISLIDGCTVAHLHLTDAQTKANERTPRTEIGDTLYGGRAKDAAANVRELERILDEWSANMDAMNKAEDEARMAEYRARHVAG